MPSKIVNAYPIGAKGLQEDIQIANCNNHELWTQCVALWDTGSSKLVIASHIAEALHLPIEGYEMVDIFDKEIQVGITHCDIYLRSGYHLEHVEANVYSSPKFDCIIGLNVITKGILGITANTENVFLTFDIPEQDV